MKDLVILIKKWAASNRINDSPNGSFSSYCLMLFVISYCQDRQPALLPPFKDLFPDLRKDLRAVQETQFSYEHMMSLFLKYKDSPAKWAEMKRQAGTLNKETLLELMIGCLIALKELVHATGQVVFGNGYKLMQHLPCTVFLFSPPSDAQLYGSFLSLRVRNGMHARIGVLM